MSRDRLEPSAERVFTLPLETRDGVKATHERILKDILGIDALPYRRSEPTANRGEQVRPQGLEELSKGLRVAATGLLNLVCCSSLVWHDRVHLNQLS